MQIGIDASNLREGGGVTHLVELLRAARPAEQGISRIFVWAGRDTIAQLPQQAWLEKIHEHLLDRSLPWRVYWQQQCLPDLAKNCDCLFVPGGNFGSRFQPFVTMSQNLLFFEKKERDRYGISWKFLKLVLLRWGRARSMRASDGVIFLTDYARRTVCESLKLNVSQLIIPHGVSNEFRLQPRPQRPISAYTPRQPYNLLYVSKIDVYKHQSNVVEAVSALRESGLPVILTLIGPVASQLALQRLRAAMAKANKREVCVFFHGGIRHDELVDHYRRADAFVFASSCENMPIILLEAMAAGLPIACSDRGPMPEILGDAGIYFDPEQPAQIRDALQSLIGDLSVRETQAWEAFRRARRFTWEKCSTQTFSFVAAKAKRRSQFDPDTERRDAHLTRD